MQLLFIGSDTPIRGDYSSGLGAADVIRVVRFDFVHVSASTLVVPRDLWGPIPGMERYGVYEERVKAAYAYGNVHAEFGNGPSLLALTLNRNFGLSVDHYLVVNRDVFVAAIDAMGGLAINISEPIGDIAAGPQILDGEAALRYTRLRPDNSSDLERIQRQNLVIEAIQVKIYSPDVIPRIPRLLAAFHGAVVTDLAPDDIQKLVCLSEYIDPESIRTFTIDESVTMSEMDSYGYEILLPDKEAILNLVADFQSGQYFELTSPDSLP